MTEAEPAHRPEPPTAYRWVVLVVISLAMFANYYVYDSIAPIADILKSDLGFTDADFGLLYTVYSIAAVIVLLIGGVIIDRFGTARSTILFAAICTVAGILNAVSSDFTVMLRGALPPRRRVGTPDRGDHHRAGEVVQGQGAQLRLRGEPDDCPTGLGRSRLGRPPGPALPTTAGRGPWSWPR